MKPSRVHNSHIPATILATNTSTSVVLPFSFRSSSCLYNHFAGVNEQSEFGFCSFDNLSYNRRCVLFIYTSDITRKHLQPDVSAVQCLRCLRFTLPPLQTHSQVSKPRILFEFCSPVSKAWLGRSTSRRGGRRPSIVLKFLLRTF